jgi:bacillithiol biosynthesis cysteine-adding enzyme BshC
LIGRRTGVEIRPAALGSSALVRDYVRGAPALAPFYAGSPFDPDAYRRKAAAVHARLPAVERGRMRPALQPTTTAAADRLERVLAGEGVAVTTGQQTGLFGGPLYTLHKVLSAVRLASELEQVLEQPVIPLFWIASDDHDWAEVDHTLVVDAQNDLLRIRIEQPGDAAPLPMSARRTGDEVRPALDALAAALPDTAYSGPLLGALREAYRPEATMAAAFQALFAHILRDVDVVLVDPSDRALKGASAPLVLREIDATDTHAAMLGRQTERLERAGYHAQVAIGRDAANVFAHDPAGRDRLVRDRDGWSLRRTRRRLADAELREWIEREPAAFSPNVLFRPVLESALLPTVAYVGGPGEVAYFGQIGCLFRSHGMEPPLVVPRASLTIIESKVRRLLDRFEMEPADFQRPFHEVLTERMRASLPATVTGPLAELRQSIEAGYDRLMEGAASIDPTLEGWVRAVRNRALSQVHDAEKKVTRHKRKRSEIEVRQLGRAAANLAPGGTAQDRALNATPYLARYGPGLIHDLLDAIDLRPDRPAPDWTGVVCD